MVHSFLLIGQSNMAGRGFVQDARPINDEHIYVLRNGRWQKIFRPVHSDRKTAGVCLAESFAQEYAKDNGVDVGLIPCADGGTMISQWMPGEVLYDHAVFQAKLAMRQSTLMGILWHQGESDCNTKNRDNYKQMFDIFISSLKKDLQIQNIPVIVGGLGDFMKVFFNNDNYLIINKALKEYAAENELVGYASANGLLPNADNLHFSSDALYEFGLRYYDEFKKLNKNSGVASSPDANLKRSDIELL